MSMKEFFRGFKKEEFTFELAKRPTEIIWTRDALDIIADRLESLPIPDISIRSVDYRVTRVNLSSVEKKGLKTEPRTVLKLCDNSYIQSGYREVVVDVIILFFDINYDTWMLEHKVAVNTRYMHNDYDEGIIDAVVDCINAHIKESKIWVMTAYKNPDFGAAHHADLELDGSAVTKGYIGVFGKHSDATSINRIIKDFYKSDSPNFDAIGKNSAVEIDFSSNMKVQELIEKSILAEYNSDDDYSEDDEYGAGTEE